MNSQLGDPLRMSIENTSETATDRGFEVSEVEELVVPDAVPAATVGLLLKTSTPFCMMRKVSPVVPSEAFVTIAHFVICPARDG